MRKLGAIGIACAAIVVLVYGSAAAQDLPAGVDADAAAVAAVQHHLRSNAPIVVVDREGRQYDGSVQRSSLTSVSLVANGQTYDLAFRDIGRIEKPGDSLVNGAVIGVVASAPYWILATAFACDGNGAGCGAATGIGTAGVFAALGAYVDSRRRGRTVIYGPDLRNRVAVFSDVWMALASGDRITVTGVDTRTEGVFQRVANGSITALVAGQIRTFAESDVQRVSRRGDSLKNGTVIGAAIGALAFISPCENDTPASDCLSAGERAAAGSFSALVFGALGALVDSLHVGHTDVYRAPVRHVTFVIHPDLTRGHRGALVSIGF